MFMSERLNPIRDRLLPIAIATGAIALGGSVAYSAVDEGGEIMAYTVAHEQDTAPSPGQAEIDHKATVAAFKIIGGTLVGVGGLAADTMLVAGAAKDIGRRRKYRP